MNPQEFERKLSAILSADVVEYSRLIDEGAVDLGGRIPVNPSGGLLAKGHPLGATGVAQIVEIVW